MTPEKNYVKSEMQVKHGAVLHQQHSIGSVQNLQLDEQFTTTTNPIFDSRLDQADYKRISEMKVIPKALVIKQLIGKRRNEGGSIPREEFNLVSQTAA